MALFNKLFNSRNRSPCGKRQDNVSEKLFAFTKDQVRLVLFRECDFRGRRLLFDSSSVKKVPVPPNQQEHEKYTEVSNGFGYIYTKVAPDFGQLAEMVFGSVAMSFRGTYFKMHSLDSPNRLMFTQVFPSPKRGRVSVSSRSCTSNQSLEHSNNKLDDSGTSSTTSIDASSGRNHPADTLLVCRRLHSSAVLDVSVSTPLSSDSGYCADNSCSNLSSGPPSLGSFDNNCASTLSFSSSSLYKRWLRRTSTSLEHSGVSSLSTCGEEYAGKAQHRTSKLGLALIIELTAGQEDRLGQFFMEHVVLLETMLWRARQVVEVAYAKSHSFVSLMVEIANLTSRYLVGLLSESYLSMNLWLLLSNGCDTYNSISAFSAAISGSMSNPDVVRRPDNNLFSLTKLLRAEWDPFNFKKNLSGDHKDLTAEKFIQDFCELLESIDVKDTNFFMSTLVTAVLTHHLGWVNTCLPSSSDGGCLVGNKGPFNPLWGELSDLYGAIGHPTKMAQTIITGTNRIDIISKILTSLTYFIRCCDVDRKIPARTDVQQENAIAEAICHNYSCIPKENYKKYEDHLREIMSSNEFFNASPKEATAEDGEFETRACLKKSKGLTKTQTCVTGLSEQPNSSSCERFHLTTEEISKKVKKLCRVPSSAVLCHMDPNFAEQHARNSATVNMEKQKSCNVAPPLGGNVVFVLGDDEKLVGLRKSFDEKPTEVAPQRPIFLDLTKTVQEGCFRDCDFVANSGVLVKPSTSWSSLHDPEQLNGLIKTGGDRGAVYSRSQSVPPEDRKLDGGESKITSKYKYSGVKKFNLQQYPQILSNYMKGKNLEMSNLHFGDKGLKFDELSSISDVISSKYPEIEDFEDCEALQTPSNASELEFTSDIFVAPPVKQHAKESNVETRTSTFIKQFLPNTIINEGENSYVKTDGRMKVANFPMPNTVYTEPIAQPVRYTSSLMRAANDVYMPDMVVQALTVPKHEWESQLKNDLALASQHSPIDQPIDEAVAVIANTDNWEVQLMSSHTFVIDKGSSGIRVGMSQLVANMLESLLQMWKLNVPPHYCLMYIEQTLQELCVRSKALAELLLATEFCNMEQLTSALQLEVNDVPLLMAVASTHSPQVTQKYGLSFQ